MVSWLVSWLLFTWMIARLPREKVSLVASMRAGLMAAIGFELFKQVGSIYLQTVLRSPAGAVFGRYHYAIDAFAGWLVALTVWLLLG